jgi:hypothetical protein
MTQTLDVPREEEEQEFWCRRAPEVDGAVRGSLLSIVSSVSRERKRKKVPKSWGKKPEQESLSRGKPESRTGEAAGDSTQEGMCGGDDVGWRRIERWRGYRRDDPEREKSERK